MYIVVFYVECAMYVYIVLYQIKLDISVSFFFRFEFHGVHGFNFKLV